MPQLGTVKVDVAYGGMFYAIAEAAQFGLRLTPDEGADITRITEMIKAAAAEQLPVAHPEQPGFNGVTIARPRAICGFFLNRYLVKLFDSYAPRW